MHSIRVQVTQAIGRMSSGEFERFVRTVLQSTPAYSKLEPNINSLGKTRRGKCDGFVYYPETETYAVLHCTTQQKQTTEKVSADIENTSRSQFALKTRIVIIAVNTPVGDEYESYRILCENMNYELDIFSLDRLAKMACENPKTMSEHFSSIEQAQSKAPMKPVRKFDCGKRVAEVRTDLQLSASQLIEFIDFPSEREWLDIEAGKLEISEDFILSLSLLSGAAADWIKHTKANKYPRAILRPDDLETIDNIARTEPIGSTIFLEPEEMHLALAVQTSQYSWCIYLFDFDLAFDTWLDDHRYIPKIYRLLESIDKKLSHPHGRIVRKNVMQKLTDSSIPPKTIIESHKAPNHWFDDLFDLNHKWPIAKDGYAHHGQWFVSLQNNFRTAIQQEKSS